MVITEKERKILAAIFARSNMGMGVPSKDDVARAAAEPFLSSVSGYVMDFCQQFMETDEHQTWFEDEALSWYDELGKKENTRERILKVHPHIGEVMWG